MALSDIALQAGQLDRSNQAPADIIEFIESPWGLNIRLYPVQRIILKAHYGLKLDDNPHGFDLSLPIPLDHPEYDDITVLPDAGESTAEGADEDIGFYKHRVKVTDWRRQNPRYMTEADYLRFLFKEKRSNISEVIPGVQRRELVLSIGRRSGKCKSADSLVVTSRGLLELRELGDTQGAQVQPLRVTVSQEGGKQADSAAFYCNGIRATRRLVTATGFTDESTPNHRIKVLDPDGVVRWRYLEDVRVGDHVAINRSTNLWPDREASTPDTQGWDIPQTVTKDFGLLLGYLVGDGTWGKKSYLELTGLEEQVQRFSEIALTVLGHPGRMSRDARSKRAWHWRFDQKSTGVKGAGRAVRQALHEMGFNLDATTTTKRVPLVIRTSPKKVVAGFLRGLFETDGTVTKTGEVSFCTASRSLAREVQLLLLNMGIVASIRPKANRKYDRTYFNVCLLGARSRKVFFQEVGFDSARKQDRLARAVLDQTDRNDNKSSTESIPHQREWCRRLLDSVPKGSRHTGKGWEKSLLRAALGNTIKPSTVDEVTYPRLAEVLPVARALGADPEVVAHFEHLVGLDYFFDPVVSIEEGECPTFDLNVPDGESFVANGMTNHNTFLCACVVAYEVYKLLLKSDPQSYYGVPKTNTIGLISVATDKEQAGLLYTEASGHFSECFAAETRIITDMGVKRIGDLAGTMATVLTRNGSWVEAPVRSFGERPLYKIVLQRQGVSKTIFTTAGHRWFAMDHRKAHRGKGFCEFTTLDLRPGVHRLQGVFGRSYKNRIDPSPFGVAHGFTFGDGTAPGNRNAASCCLYGEKDRALLPFFEGCPQTPIPPDEGEVPDTYSTGHKRLKRTVHGIRIGALPNFFKDFPSKQENKAYLLGWLMGYFAADGSVSASAGQVTMCSADRENIEFFRDVCILLGIGTYDIQDSEKVSNITGRSHLLFKMGLMRHTLDASFFIVTAHRDAFLAAGGEDLRRQAFLWAVESVEPTNRVDEVFCATVEGHGDFVLEGNIATGNCAYFKPYTANNTMSYAKFQTPEDIKRFGRYVDDQTAKATIKVSFKSCVAKGLRGAGNIVIILDELAHFNDAGQSDALKIYQAIKPSLAAFSPKNKRKRAIGPVEGRILSISSPLGKQGFFFKKFRQGFSAGLESQNMLCIQAPTWEVNPTVEATFLAEQYATDSISFFTEYGADFTDRTRGWLEPEHLLACVDPSLRPAFKAPLRAPHFMGIDISAGKKDDGDYCAVAIGHIDDDGNVVLDLIERIRGGEGDYKTQDRLSFDDISEWLFALSRRFYISSGVFDQWAGLPFEMALHKKGLTQCKSVFFTKQLTSQAFQNFKDMMYERKLVLYDWPLAESETAESNHSLHISELMALQAEVHSKYLITVEAPQGKGSYDDMSDALVRMIWEATQYLGKQKYIAGNMGRKTSSHGSSLSARDAAMAQRKARTAGRLGGSSPDRQRSTINRGSIRGRR